MQRRTLAITSVAVILLASVAAAIVDSRGGGDGTSGTTPVTSMGELAGAYVATTVYATPSPIVRLADVSIEFDGDRVMVRTGCNSVGFHARMEDSRLVPTDEATMTEMGCVPTLAAQEAMLVAAFTQGVRLERSGPYLSIHWGAGASGPATDGATTNNAGDYSLGFTDKAWLASSSSTATG